MLVKRVFENLRSTRTEEETNESDGSLGEKIII